MELLIVAEMGLCSAEFVATLHHPQYQTSSRLDLVGRILRRLLPHLEDFILDRMKYDEHSQNKFIIIEEIYLREMSVILSSE